MSPFFFFSGCFHIFLQTRCSRDRGMAPNNITISNAHFFNHFIVFLFFSSAPEDISPSWALFPRSLQWCSVTADYMHSSTVIRRVRVRVWERHRRHLAFYRSERLNKHQQLFPVLEWQERSPFIFGKRNVFYVSLKVSLKCPKLIQTESPSPLFRLDKKTTSRGNPASGCTEVCSQMDARNNWRGQTSCRQEAARTTMGVQVIEIQIYADVGMLHKYYTFNGEDVFTAQQLNITGNIFSLPLCLSVVLNFLRF